MKRNELDWLLREGWDLVEGDDDEYLRDPITRIVHPMHIALDIARDRSESSPISNLDPEARDLTVKKIIEAREKLDARASTGVASAVLPRSSEARVHRLRAGHAPIAQTFPLASGIHRTSDRFSFRTAIQTTATCSDVISPTERSVAAGCWIRSDATFPRCVFVWFSRRTRTRWTFSIASRRATIRASIRSKRCVEPTALTLIR